VLCVLCVSAVHVPWVSAVHKYTARVSAETPRRQESGAGGSLDFLTRETAFALLVAATLILGVLWVGSMGRGQGRR